jgi:type I thyroxine 5'-deiodinase
MAKLSKVSELATLYGDVADFATIYIMEAHPADGWRLEGNDTMMEGVEQSRNFEQHKSLADRLEAAAHLLTHRAMVAAERDGDCEESRQSMPLFVDSMGDDANLAYGALFERLYVIKDGKVAVQGGKGPSNYFVSDVSDWLMQEVGDRGFSADGL